VSRLATLTNDLASTANDLTIGPMAYNPASQIVSQDRSNDAYAWTGHFNQNDTGTANGLNQLTAVGAKSLGHDAKGNVTAFGSDTFAYSSENLLTSATIGGTSSTLDYDALLRLRQVAGSATTRFAYDGLDMIAEYDATDVLQRRYVHGPGADEPIVWYEGADLTNRRWLHADERGSIVAVSDAAGASMATNTYDEFGIPGTSNLGRFQYTGRPGSRNSAERREAGSITIRRASITPRSAGSCSLIRSGIRPDPTSMHMSGMIR
jgi:hypothetical protein